MEWNRFYADFWEIEKNTIDQIIRYTSLNDFMCIKLNYEELVQLPLDKEYSRFLRIIKEHVPEFYYVHLSNLDHKVEYEDRTLMEDWKNKCQSLNNAK